ncbi:VOC family protein [Paenibacillus motobuensis]|uniref:VOC family protein n=1 Tax=Paenibacillus TaxID=44249 RepID=UPI00203E9011|nr:MULTISPECIES: VOC family protein [Paenibacillus]MCM3041281.1 VOC family protein [Paenibacillus lutimineralis]MCM3648385.1 VOC family protein [Paenibacillus motobuensis]
MEEKKITAPQKQQVTQKPLLKRVLCNYLPVSNLEHATKWYEEIFGLSVRKRDPNGSILILGDGQWLFLLESTEKRTANFITSQWDGDEYEMFSLTFEVENIVELHKRLRENEVDVESLVDHDSCGLQFKFKDPDGNKFNVWQDPNSA